MNIDAIQTLGRGEGKSVVPQLSDYAAASSDWSEVEYRASLGSSSSIVGYWEGTPGWVDIAEWPYHEICVVLEGRIRITDAADHSCEFGAGESFVIPRGFSGRWTTLEATRKIFVGVDPKGLN